MTRYAAAAVPLALVPALGAVQGGFLPDAWVWSTTLVAWAAAVALVVDPRGGRLRDDFGWPLLATALLTWTTASALWSVAPTQSLLEARRTLLYATVVLALVVLARSGSRRPLLTATHVGVVALVLYALVRYLFGTRVYLEFEGHLLTEPLGYANAIGILAAIALVLTVAAAPARAAWAMAAPPLALSLELTGSTASWLALAAALALLVALEPRRGALLTTCASLLLPVAAAVWLARQSALSGAGEPRIGGTTVALGVAACAVAAGFAATLAARRTFAVPVRRGVVVSVLALAVVVAAAAVARGAATEPRRSYYAVTWHEYTSHPLLGSGAGTFARFWAASGNVPRWGGALDAHSLYLEALAELGPVGVLLLFAFLLYPLRGAIVRRAVPGVPAAAAAATAFLVHATLDWDWELPAVVVPFLACSAVVAFAGREERAPVPARGRWLALAAALAAGAVAIACAHSSATPSAENERGPAWRGL